MPGSKKEAAQRVVLDAVLDLKAAERLKATLVERRGRPLDIDASAVQRLGGLCLQVLVSAHNTWRVEGVPMRIAASSTEFAETLKLFGADTIFQTSEGVLS